MAFAIHGTDIPCFQTYAQAKEFYGRAKPFTGAKLRDLSLPYAVNREDARQLSTNQKYEGYKQKPHFVIFMSGENVVCRYHSTDLVTYHPGDMITIHTWESMSSQCFINHLIPSGLYAKCTGPQAYLAVHNGACWTADTLCYQFPDRTSELTIRKNDLTGNWEPDEVPQPWTKRTINRKVANVLLKQLNWNEFRLFVNSYLATSGLHAGKRSWYEASDVIEHLAARNIDGWIAAVEHMGSQTISRVTVAIHRHWRWNADNVFNDVEVEVLPYPQVATFLKARNRY